MLNRSQHHGAVRAERDAAIAHVSAHAGPAFRALACPFVVAYLTEHGATSGEDLTMACLDAGIAPHDDRAFGAVYLQLSRSGTIEKCGVAIRKRGHLTSGGNLWRLSAPLPVEDQSCLRIVRST